MAEGRVIVNQRRRFLVESDDGEHVHCIVKGRKLLPVAGDIVEWRRLDATTALIETIHERRTVLCRYESRRGKQPVAANIDQVLVTMAVEPAFDTYLLDKYLVAAQASNVDALVVLNKSDLLKKTDELSLGRRLAEYAEIGYQVLEISVQCDRGKPALIALLESHSTALVGASGVGKSSLVNWLLPEEAARVGELSAATAEGRHTTTSSRLYRLPQGGDLIDSPGVRDFMLWPMPIHELEQYFLEFQEVKVHCKFNNCTHLEEPQCAIIAAVESGRILKRRYDSYRGLARIMASQYSTIRSR